MESKHQDMRLSTTAAVAKKTYRIEGKYIYRDICTLVFVWLSTTTFKFYWVRFVKVNNQTGHLTGVGNILMAMGIYAVLYFVIGRWLHAFKIGVERKANILASHVLTLLVVDVIEVFISCAITGQIRFIWNFTRAYFQMWIVASIVNCLISILMVNIYRKAFPPLHVIEIYGERLNKLYLKIITVKYKYNVTDLLSCDEDESIIRERIKPFDAVLLNDLPARKKNRILKICFSMDKRVYFVPKISDILVKNSEELNLFDTPLFLDRNHGMRMGQRALKRFFDILLSVLAIGILSPILLITSLAIKHEDGGPIFYKQERVTLNGRHFMILKFRSMIVDAEKDGKPHPAGEKDDRITKVGHVIRACRIDELPQLINILKGDMSIVGPRPERWEHCDKYREEIPEWDLRNKVRGGLTGYAQVYGKYNTEAIDKLKMDLIYITNYSLLLDLQIIFETIKILFQKESTEGFTEDKILEMHGEVEEDGQTIEESHAENQ